MIRMIINKRAYILFVSYQINSMWINENENISEVEVEVVQAKWWVL